MRDKMLQILLLFIVFLFPFFLGKLFFFPQYILFCILILLLVFSLKKIKLSYLFPFVLFFVLSITSVGYTFSLAATRGEILRVANYFILFYLFLVYFQDNIWKERLLDTLLVSAMLVCLYGLGIYFLVGEKNLLLFSTFFNPNCFASYLILILPLAIYKLLTSHNFISLNRYSSLTIILFLCLFLTASRGAFVSLFIGGIIWLVVVRNVFKINKPLKIIAFFCIIISLLLFLTRPILQERLYSFFNPSHRSHLYRMLVYKGTLNIIKNYPLGGTGAGTFETVYPDYKLGSVNTKLTHSTYLQIASEMGMIGLFSFLFLFIFILKNLFFQFKRAQVKEEKLFLSCILFISINFLMHNLFDYPWHIPGTSGIYFVLAAVGMNYGIKTKEVNPNKKIKLLLLFFIVLINWFCIRWGVADWSFQKGEEEKEKNIKLAEKYFTKATKLDPISASYHNSMGNIYLKQEKYPQAKVEFQKAIKLEGHSAFYHTDLGMAYLHLGEMDKAIYEFKTAQGLHKTFTVPLRELGNIYLKQRKLQKARDEFRKIIIISEMKYFQDKYSPIPGQEENSDIKYAKMIIEILSKAKISP